MKLKPVFQKIEMSLYQGEKLSVVFSEEGRNIPARRYKKWTGREINEEKAQKNNIRTFFENRSKQL